MGMAIDVHLLLQSVYRDQLKRFQVGEDSPVFPGLFSYCQVRASGGGNARILWCHSSDTGFSF